MKKFLAQILLLLLSATLTTAQDSKPLRIFIRAGTKTHGPGQHDHPQFLKDWTELLNQRGAQAKGKIGFPTAAELADTDVLVFYTEEGGTITMEDRANLDKFLKRGGKLVYSADKFAQLRDDVLRSRERIMHEAGYKYQRVAKGPMPEKFV